MDRFDCMKMKIFCMSKLNHQIKRQKKYGLGNIFAANMTDEGLISLLNKELIRLSAKTWRCIGWKVQCIFLGYSSGKGRTCWELTRGGGEHDCRDIDGEFSGGVCFTHLFLPFSQIFQIFFYL